MAMLHQLASLAEIQAGVAAPHPDVLLLSLDRLRDAPAARDLLVAHEEAVGNCWRTINLTQVRTFSILAILLEKANGRMGKVVRAIQKMEDLEEQVEVAGIQFYNCFGVHGSGATGMSAINLVGTALDAAHTSINALLQDGFTLAKSTAYLSYTQDCAISLLEGALTTLRDSNRSVARRLHRLQRVAGRLRLLNRSSYGSMAHSLFNNDLELELIAGRFSVSVEQLIDRLQARQVDINIISFVQEEISEQLATKVIFNHARFTGVLSVKSLSDLDEVMRISTPHHGLAPRHVEVHLRGLNLLLSADAMTNRVNEGINDRGWVVRGISALNKAQQIDALLSTLTPSLDRLFSRDVIGLLGDVHDLAAITDVEEQVKAINNILFADSFVPEKGVRSPAVMGLITEVQQAVIMAQSSDLMLRSQLMKVIEVIELTRSESVMFY